MIIDYRAIKCLVVALMPARAGVSARARWAERIVCRRSGHRARGGRRGKR